MPGDIDEVVFLNTWAQYGLTFYLNAEVEELELTTPRAFCVALRGPGNRLFAAPREYVNAVHGLAAGCGRYPVRKRFVWRESVFMTIDTNKATVPSGPAATRALQQGTRRTGR